MRAQELIGLPVLYIGEGRQVGRVRGLVIDPRRRQIAALSVRTRGLLAGRRLLLIDNVFGMGADAVTVREPTALQSPNELSDLRPLLRNGILMAGTDAITDQGDRLGLVKDYAIDAHGRITELFIADASWLGLRRRDAQLAGTFVQAVGRDAVVVSAAATEALVPLSDSPDGAQRARDTSEADKPNWLVRLRGQPRNPAVSAPDEQNQPPPAQSGAPFATRKPTQKPEHEA